MLETIKKSVFGFTGDPACNNCFGTTVFVEDENGEPVEPCIFCIEAAMEGVIEGVNYVRGRFVMEVHFHSGLRNLKYYEEGRPCK